MMRTRHKPFRTLKTPVGEPDHFTVEEADAAVLAVMAERGETPVLDVIEEISFGGDSRDRSLNRPEAA